MPAGPTRRAGVPAMGALLCLATLAGPASAQGTGQGQAQGTADLAGLWATEEPGATVRITRCGRGFCGTLASTGEGSVDVNNPNPALRNRRLVGLPIFPAGTPIPNGQEGTLYNPKDGKTYSGRLVAKGPDALVVSGCVLGFLCRSQTWTRLR